MIGFFETLEKVSAADKHRTAEWMSTHPAPEHRIERIAEEAKLLKIRPARTETSGLGPVQTALKTKPADLTRISARNGGTFPTEKVRRFISERLSDWLMA